MDDIRQLHATCRQAEEEWKRDVEQALAIKHMLALQSDGPVDSSTPATIGSKLEDADARAALTELDDEIEHEAEREAARRAREAELEEARRQKEREEAELLAKATSPEVKAVLAPFLEPRNVQPRLSGASIAFTTTVDKQPMSLAALHGINALADSEQGLRRLAQLGGHRKLPEPRWSVGYLPNRWTDDEREMLKTAQRMLREYGPILVKAGLLSQ